MFSFVTNKSTMWQLLLLLISIEKSLALNNVCKSDADYATIQVNPNCWHNLDLLTDMETMVTNHNYPIENYTVTTKDGYILTLFRIPGDNLGKKSTKEPILILHGIGATSQSAVAIGNRSMAFYYARQGFDVWMGNFRGNKYSRAHKILNTSVFNADYWKFSLYHLGVYDMAAFIKKINEITGKNGEIICLGHSMGTTAAFIYSAHNNLDAEHNLKGIIAMAPVAYLNNSPSINNLAKVAPTLTNFLNLIGVHGLFTLEDLQASILVPLVANWPEIVLARDFINLQYGVDPQQILSQDIPMYFNNWPSGIGVNIILNYIDFITKEIPQGLDYGILNLEIYGSLTPPIFNYGNIKVPVHLFYGPNDTVADYKDAQHLYNVLTTNKKSIEPISTNETIPFNHIDFIFAKDVETLLYEPIMDIIQSL